VHEDWLQRYIKDHYQQLGFTEIHGPYKRGADFKGVYAGKRVKIEAEWDYSDYIIHGHSLSFADVLVVANLKTVPDDLRAKLPPVIIHLDRDNVIEWAQPRRVAKNKEDYHGYAWRRLSRSLLDLYVNYRQRTKQSLDFTGYKVALSMFRSQTPSGFQFGTGGIEKSFEGPQEDKIAWDYWLIVAHSVAKQFELKPAFLRPTWIDRIALLFNYTGRITNTDLNRFQEVAFFIDELLSLNGSNDPAPVQNDSSGMDELKLRDVRPDELEEVAQLLVDSYQQYKKLLSPESWDWYRSNMLDIGSRIADSSLIVAEVDNRVAGTITLYSDGTKAGWPMDWSGVRLLAVHPAYRGRGIGRALIEECIRRCCKLGIKTLGLHTAEFMEVAREMYERMGFKRVQEFDFHPGPDKTIFAYRLDL
jgi:GNAT superfamily N-acetyltransferase